MKKNVLTVVNCGLKIGDKVYTDPPFDRECKNTVFTVKEIYKQQSETGIMIHVTSDNPKRRNMHLDLNWLKLWHKPKQNNSIEEFLV